MRKHILKIVRQNFIQLSLRALVCSLLPGLVLLANLLATSPASARNANKNIDSSGSAIMAGDQIKIRFFSKISLRADKVASGTPRAATRTTLYERTDLSGDFTVSEGGTLSHPRFGLVFAAGKKLPELELLFKKAYRKKTGHPVQVRAIFKMRQPIYVAGMVANPGAYKYMQGMTVVQVITLASGIYREEKPGQIASIIRKKQALVRKYQRQLSFVLIRKARLQAAINDQEKIVVPDNLVKLVGAKQAREMLKTEDELFQRTRVYKQFYKQKLLEAKEMTAAELQMLDKQKKNFLKQQKVVEQKLMRYRKLYRRTRVRTSMRASKEMAQFELQHLNLINQQTRLASDMLQAKQRVNGIEQQLAVEGIRDLTKLKKEMDVLQEQFIEYEASLLTSRAVLADLRDKNKNAGGPARPGSQKHLVYELTRRSGGRFVAFAASPNTFLKPGDVVKVKYEMKEFRSGHLLQQ